MLLAVIAATLFYSWFNHVPLQEPGVQQFQVQKEWVVPTLQKEDNTFRKTHRMKPLVLSDKVIQGNAVDGILAVQRESGKTLWQIPVVGGVEGGVAQINDRIFFGGNDGQFYAANTTKGEVLWKFPTKTEVLSAPALWEGQVYFLAGNNVLYALDAAEGRELWIYSRVDSQNFSIRGASTPIINKGVLYMGFSDGYLVALDAKTGAIKWEQSLNKNKKFKDLDSTAVIDGEFLYITGFDAALYCVRLASGELVWKTEPGGYGDVLVHGDKIIYSTSSSQVLALNKKNGQKIWSYSLADGVATSPELYQNKIVFAESQGRVVFLNPETGKLVGSFEPGRGSFSPLAMDEKKHELYFISREALLYKLKTEVKDSNAQIPWLQ